MSHPRETEQPGVNPGNGADSGAATNPQKSSRQALRERPHVTNHAGQCDGTNCFENCGKKMESVVQHTKQCKKKTSCLICRQFMKFCYLHVKQCQSPFVRCSVPYCFTIKRKMMQKLLNQDRSDSEASKSPQESPRHRFFIQSLAHAYRSSNAGSCMNNCKKTKSSLKRDCHHTSRSQRKTVRFAGTS